MSTLPNYSSDVTNHLFHRARSHLCACDKSDMKAVADLWLPDSRSATLAAHITAFSPCLIPTCGCINVSVCCRSDVWQLLHLRWVQRWCLAPLLSKRVVYNCTRHVSSTSACCCLCLQLFFSPFLSNWQYKYSLILFCSAVNHVVAPTGRPHPRTPLHHPRKGATELSGPCV